MKKLLVLAILLLGFETSKAQQWDINGNLGILPFHFVGSINNAALNFGTNNVQRATILANGLVGIGTAAPTNQLQVNGAALSTVFRTDNNAGVAPLWSMFKGATNIGNLYGNGGANNIFNVEANMADLYLWGRGNNAGTNNALQPRLIVSNGNQVNAAAAIIVPNVTKIGINYDPAVGLTVPQTALHIGPFMGANIGYQTWMDLGTLYNNGCHMYTGMKLENSNRYDAVINWGNDLAGVGGPDFLRFIFTQLGAGGTAGQSFDGEEVARFAPTGNIGLGNFWVYGANTLPNRRLELLDADPNSTTRANQNLPQLRLTYLYNPIVTSGIWTDFQTQNNGNLQINTSNDELPQRVGINNGTGALTRTLDVAGNLRLRTLPQIGFNKNGNAAINRVLVSDANGEIFWRDDIGPGGAGIITADNGLSRTPNNSNVQLGQIVGAGGSPGRLLHNTEIPMNNFDVYFPEPAFPNGGNRVAIGTVTPLGKFHVQKSGPVFLNTVHYAGYFVNSEQSSSDGYGIHVETTGANKNNTAGEFKASNGIGGNTGVYAEGVSTSSNSVGGNFYASTTNSLATGLRAEGSGGANVFGIDASAINGTNFNYGIIATGGTNCNNGGPCPDAAGFFDGSVYTTDAYYISSDSILKQNIKQFKNGLTLLSQFSVKEYEYNKSNFPSMILPSGKHVGLIAQDVEKVMPELVKQLIMPERVDPVTKVVYPKVDFKAVNYTELIPILIAGMLEQDAKINDLQTQLNTCCSSNKNTSNTNHTITTKLSDIETIILDQNEPNPFAEETNINYFIPESAGKAEIMFYTNDGRLINKVEIKEKGQGSLHIYASDLSSGIYTYTLMVNGKVVETKKMMKGK